MPIMTGGQAVVETLLAEGVDTIFGIPGTDNLDIYDALIDHPEIRRIVTRNEQGAALMAEAYGRVSRRPGITIATTGPGAAGTIIGLQEAYGSSTPLFVIMSEIASDYIGKSRGVLHETKDQLGLFSCVTAWSRRAESVEAIPLLIHEAFAFMRSGRPRPCTLDIPLDILASSSDVTIQAPYRDKDDGKTHGHSPVVETLDRIAEALDRVAERLVRAKHPILYAGGGVLTSDASSELQTLAELLRAPVLTSINGKGAIPEDHPLSLGNWGMFEPIRSVVKESDAVLAVGTRFGNRATGRWAVEFSPDALMQIDIDPSEIGKNYPVALGIVVDAKGILRYLVVLLQKQMSHPSSSTFSVEQIAALRHDVKTQLCTEGPVEMKLLDDIRKVLPRDTIIANDSTVVTYWGRRSFPVYEPRTFLWPMGSGTIGYGLPAAVGAKVAYPDRPVVAICGDGGFLFSCQELATAVRYRLAIPILLFNDEAYGVIGHYQRTRFRRDVDIDLANPDFMKFADAFGVWGVRLDTLDDIAPAIEKALITDRPTIIEVRTHLTPPSLI
ncbi:MAG: thiamine pyrophosphate-binding protein [Candidatus Latescibacteria bacterium]|nr:thiamine pyrophosphate-binding protein [Candidatus Latescibacterota bacterium]